MKRLCIFGLLLICMMLLTMNLVNAQEFEPIKPADLFSWAKSTPPDWARGGLYAGLGLIGAMVIIFGLIGGAVPGTAGKAKIDADANRLENMSRRLEELITSSNPDAQLIKEVGDQIDKFRDDLRRERWIQFSIATVFYTILGAFFSALLAKDLLQALVIGAGWTGLIGTLGLKKDFSVRKAAKDASLEKTFSRAKEVEEKLKVFEAELKGKAIPFKPMDFEPLAKLEREVKIAQKL